MGQSDSSEDNICDFRGITSGKRNQNKKEDSNGSSNESGGSVNWRRR